VIKVLLSLILALQPAQAGFVVYGTGGEATTVTVLDYSSGTPFTYTSSDVEFTDGGAKLKSQYASDVLFAATYTSGLNAVYSKFNGSLTASTSGTVSAASGKADLRADANFKHLKYVASLNFPVNGVGGFKMKATPNYTGTPSTRQFYFQTGMQGSNVDTVFWEHHTDGRVYWYVYSSGGATIVTNDFAWSPTAGVEYEIYGHWDVNTGTTQTYIDGIQKATSAATGSRDNRMTYFQTGGADNDIATDHADYKIDDWVLFNAVQHTSNYTPGYTVSDTKYLTTNPFVEQTVAVTVSSWVAITGVQSVVGSDNVKCQIRDDGTLKYHNGAAWVNSDGSYSQASTLTEINNQIATAPTGSEKLRCALHSDSGATTPTLSSVVMEYM
jgi:hypothetical protein